MNAWDEMHEAFERFFEKMDAVTKACGDIATFIRDAGGCLGANEFDGKDSS
jgi:hypothetical protein